MGDVMEQTDPNIETRFNEIELKLNSIVERNRKVELEKAWETSSARKVTIVVLTYLVMCLIFYVIGVTQFLGNAIVPTIGYFLSTQSLPVLRRWWLERSTRSRPK